MSASVDEGSRLTQLLMLLVIAQMMQGLCRCTLKLMELVIVTIVTVFQCSPPQIGSSFQLQDLEQ